MNITKDWLETLAKKYGVKPKVIRDSLWPDTPNRGLGYFDTYKNIRVKYLEIIADALNCSVDEILRRPIPSQGSQMISGDNNHVGNVNINNEGSLKKIIDAQNEVISHLDAEIKRMERMANEQLKIKDQQIDKLIELIKRHEDQ